MWTRVYKGDAGATVWVAAVFLGCSILPRPGGLGIAMCYVQRRKTEAEEIQKEEKESRGS